MPRFDLVTRRAKNKYSQDSVESCIRTIRSYVNHHTIRSHREHFERNAALLITLRHHHDDDDGVDDNHRFLESDDGSDVRIFPIIIALSIAGACLLNPFGCMLRMKRNVLDDGQPF